MKEKADKYNYGIDVLKIVGTLMIIVMHVLGQGGVIRNTQVGDANYYIAWTIETLSYVAVNLYALSTGYLCVKHKVKMSGLIKRWLQVLFFTVFFTGLFTILIPSAVSIKSWIKAFIPILSNQYWYFTQYFVLFMAMPFLNKMIISLEKKDLKKLVLVIIFVLSFIPMIRQYDIFLTGHGFSAIWLMALYIIGGYFSLYKDDIKYSKKALWGTITFSTLLAVGVKFAYDAVNHLEVNDMLKVILIDYTSFPIVLSSLAILLLCSNMNIKNGKKAIHFLGTLTFGIYLFHVNGFIWEYLMRDLFAFLGTSNPAIMIIGMIGGITIIFVVGGIFEFLRIKLFDVLHIDKLSNWVGKKLEALEDYLVAKL